MPREAALEKAKRQKKKKKKKILPQKVCQGVPVVAQWLTNPTRNHEVAGSVPALAQWVNDPVLPVSCGVGRRRSADPALLVLQRRPAAAAPIGPLAWEPPYAAEADLKKTTNKQTKRQQHHLLVPHTHLSFSFFLSLLFRAVPVAYRRSQARG